MFSLLFQQLTTHVLNSHCLLHYFLIQLPQLLLDVEVGLLT